MTPEPLQGRSPGRIISVLGEPCLGVWILPRALEGKGKRSIIRFMLSAHISESGLSLNKTTDGTCGKANGNTVCGDWANGNCCSRLVIPQRTFRQAVLIYHSGGYCGYSSDHCGSGCQSGDCVKGGQTTDGTCGATNKNMVCGSWPQGGCCSPSGFCGNSAGHCGDGCQSGCTTVIGGTTTLVGGTTTVVGGTTSTRTTTITTVVGGTTTVINGKTTVIGGTTSTRTGVTTTVVGGTTSVVGGSTTVVGGCKYRPWSDSLA
jgi:hypothetical protein